MPTPEGSSKSRDRQLRDVYQFIKAYIEKYDFSPSITEISDGCYISKGTVYMILQLLAARGFIDRTHGMARSIRLTDEPFSI